MQFKNYEDNKVKLLWATPDPMNAVSTALKITMKKNFLDGKTLSPKTIQSVVNMGHTSVFEHVVYSFLILGASRSHLAQITRHRMASYTSGSQHYQVYSDYGARGHKSLTGVETFQNAIAASMEAYNKLVDDGYHSYEARQVLPNGMENNLLFTINARSLINFLSLRTCKRNTAEIKDVADKIHVIAKEHFPELFDHVGPPCKMVRDMAMVSFPELLTQNGKECHHTRFCSQSFMSACKK